MDALFGNRGQAPQRPPPQQQHSQRLPPPGHQQQHFSRPDPRQYNQQQPPARRHPSMKLRPVKFPDQSKIFANVCLISQRDFAPPSEKAELYLLVRGQRGKKGDFVLLAEPNGTIEPGTIGLNGTHRDMLAASYEDLLDVEVFNPHGIYLRSMEIEVAYATTTEGTDNFTQEGLARSFKNSFGNQVLAPQQSTIMDTGARWKLGFTVRTAALMDSSNIESPEMSRTDSEARGILHSGTQIDFVRGPGSKIRLEQSMKKPSTTAIIRPDFKFEDMGIGGLDKEFSDIFRRAFASRMFGRGILEKLGIQPVRGMLLYGPPGTGKTLIAREIGKMLGAEDKIQKVNGPEVLNKFVGASEEKIRDLFKPAEQAMKNSPDDPGLYIIIFDELDAVCKQRGSGTGGGTGVGDSIVNQLLSKLDGVDQLDNILLIGMTNRKDMIDDALLRPGRLEVHMEISLPDEFGRQQILKIHTAKMLANKVLADDVNLAELARETRNFSGAELSGLIKAATSYAFQRHIKPGTAGTLQGNINDMKVNRADFILALDEVKPLFGVSEAALADCVSQGIIHYSERIDKILSDGKSYVDAVRNSTNVRLTQVLIYGPRGSGKTALAAQIALDSEFPFVKMISPRDVVGMNEMQKIQHLQKVFTDAYKSPLNAIVIDDFERLIDWVPIGPRFSSGMLSALNALMGTQPPNGRPLLILVTTSSRMVLQQLEVEFQFEIAVPSVLTSQELRRVMVESEVFGDERAIESALLMLEESTGTKKIGVGIRDILAAIEVAKNQASREAKVERFVEIISSRISPLLAE